MSGPVPELADRAARCAEAVMNADEVVVASHIDADGLTSAAVATETLKRCEIPHQVVFRKQLDGEGIKQISELGADTVLFTDFGSGQLRDIKKYAKDAFTPVVVDHHQPVDVEIQYHLNPLLEGIDGAAELSGAGTTYVLSRALEDTEGANKDLAALAIVGAIGDRQLTNGTLTGANTAIVEEGVQTGVLKTQTDLSLYGKQTRELPDLLAYAGDIRIPGITGDRNGTVQFLDGLDIEVRSDESWKRWVDLSESSKKTLASALIQKAMTKGISTQKIDQLIGESYILSTEQEGTELRDASEFSTLLNATARYERADVGLAVCLGDRDKAYEKSQRLLRNHRRNLSEGVTWVENTGVERENQCQWFHAQDNIKETIVGIVAGMALGVEGVSRDRPIIAFANKTDDTVKVSARATSELTGKGVDLSEVMYEAANAVEGEGGGHTIAAGATIPSGTEETFLDVVERTLKRQREE
ncbi:DHH family phosphoesterase [Salinarchaeum sp. IM2453]|uniref:single-stranded-DNA-specific exonuclease RecJ n=1 Tax=Salinarchaeum sp. IM2453 TaxID=2862870 RepID=UPI001C837440|nr:DHH family phosphoesterase [Salinarchaeum sp. IM2453]QZA89298.1 DHH family phosphoesterase [Salinarchaeum sp. IM2453]